MLQLLVEISEIRVAMKVYGGASFWASFVTSRRFAAEASFGLKP